MRRFLGWLLCRVGRHEWLAPGDPARQARRCMRCAIFDVFEPQAPRRLFELLEPLQAGSTTAVIEDSCFLQAGDYLDIDGQEFVQVAVLRGSSDRVYLVRPEKLVVKTYPAGTKCARLDGKTLVRPLPDCEPPREGLPR